MFPIQCDAGSQRIIIRPLAQFETDLSSVLEVYRLCEDFLALGPVPYASVEMIQSDLEHSRAAGCTFCGIYSAAGEMLGVVDFAPGGFEGDPGLAFLSLLMIAAPHRGKGLGEAVVGAVEAHICRAGRAGAVASGVQVNNPGAVRFWQRMGYKIVSGAELMSDGTVVYRLWKNIGQPNINGTSEETLQT